VSEESDRAEQSEVMLRSIVSPRSDEQGSRAVTTAAPVVAGLSSLGTVTRAEGGTGRVIKIALVLRARQMSSRGEMGPQTRTTPRGASPLTLVA
jgi:hypothetical protein